jgi:hypothetical protein
MKNLRIALVASLAVIGFAASAQAQSLSAILGADATVKSNANLNNLTLRDTREATVLSTATGARAGADLSLKGNIPGGPIDVPFNGTIKAAADGKVKQDVVAKDLRIVGSRDSTFLAGATGSDAKIGVNVEGTIGGLNLQMAGANMTSTLKGSVAGDYKVTDAVINGGRGNVIGTNTLGAGAGLNVGVDWK